MGRPPSKRGNVNSAENLDIISNLPVDVKNKILCHLPIKDAVRTSILSSRWRYVWASIPDLVLSDEDCVPSLGYATHRLSVLKLADLVLFLHFGPIHKFSITSKEHCHEAFDRWMLALSRNGINELMFKLTSGEKYRIPSSFFSCHALEHVHLHNCIVTLPRKFKGFRLLRTLKLENFTFSGSTSIIENFVSGCPLLENLSLKKFKDFASLKIHAPKLQELYIDGEFTDLHLRTPHLVRASIGLDKDPVSQCGSVLRACKSNIVQALGCLALIERLGIHSYFITYLGYGSLLKELPTTFDHLKEISVELYLGDHKEASTVLLLLQNAPMLQVLDIWSVSGTENASGDASSAIVTLWSKITTLEHVFKHLRSVNIHNFDGTEPELALVESLLGTAPVLEKLNLSKEHLRGAQIDPSVLMKLLQFERASNKARIIFV